MQKYTTPKKLAYAIGVSEATVKRWCDRGLIHATRTAGGHRRILLSDVVESVKQGHVAIQNISQLGLVSMDSDVAPTLEILVHKCCRAMIHGNDKELRALLMQHYIEHQSIVSLCEQLVTPAFHKLGELWKCGEVEIFEERRGCELIFTVLREVESFLQTPSQSNPSALVATMQGDRYEIPTALVALVLKESGYNVQKIGSDIPTEALMRAIEKIKPSLLCLSVSYISSEPDFVEQIRQLYQAAVAHDCMLIIGGQALTDDIRKKASFDIFCDDLFRLQALLKKLTINVQNQSAVA